MIEDPQDQRPTDGAASEDEPDEDEITLDELESDPSRDLFDSDDESAPEDSPVLHVSPREDREFEESSDDEITLDELDVDTAGYFEVSAVGSGLGASQQPDPPPQDDAMFEVEAAPAPREGENEPLSRDSDSPPSRPRQNSSTSMSDSENIRRLQDVEVEVIATLGTTRLQIRDILGLHVGSVVELHKVVGEPVDVTLNGRLIARGEVVVVDEKFAIRVNEITGSES